MADIERENWNYNVRLPPTPEEVWLRIVEATIKAGCASSLSAVTHADVILQEYKNRFGPDSD